MAPDAPDKRNKSNLVWIDCEMTGLDPSRHVILEIASIVTTSDLDIVALGPDLAVAASQADLDNMDDWSREAHTKSGLLDRVAAEGVPLERAEQETLAFIGEYCYERTSPLCGNSIGQDKIFLAAYMPRIRDFLHYRVVDVSSVKILVELWYSGRFPPPQKRESHRALTDIQESIEELRYYRSRVFVRE